MKKSGNIKLCNYYWGTILKENLKQIDGMKDFYLKENDDPELLENLIEISELGHKIVESNYFEESDALADSCWGILNDNSDDKLTDKITKTVKLIDNKWLKTYKKEYKAYRKDINKFFKLISKHIGE